MQAAAYGKCVVADYHSIHKDMCAKEFMKLKECFLVSYPLPSCTYQLGRQLMWKIESVQEAIARSADSAGICIKCEDFQLGP